MNHQTAFAAVFKYKRLNYCLKALPGSFWLLPNDATVANGFSICTPLIFFKEGRSVLKDSTRGASLAVKANRHPALIPTGYFKLHESNPPPQGKVSYSFGFHIFAMENDVSLDL